MNVKISYNWLKEHIKLGISAKEFAKQFSLHSQTIDRVVKTSNFCWKNIVTAKILETKPHPNADKLKLALVDTGREKFEIVCGAPNIKPGQIVPLALVGAEVINPEDKNVKFEVKKVKIRGIESCGMMCSERELGIGEDHTGIFILSEDTKIGINLENTMPKRDEVLEIEVTSNRPDCMAVTGLAKEASVIFNKKVLTSKSKPNLKINRDIPLKIKIETPKLCPRYQGVVMADVEVRPSPLWMQERLLAAGFRPINNLVDITNYVLLEYGQPMHVFDYEKLKDQAIIVRLAQKGEKILALDGNEYALTENNLVIADSKNPVAIAGVMGGELSAVIERTKTIVFEAACFEPIQVRKTARSLNLYSDSSNLFEKGLSIEGPNLAMLRAIELAQKLAGAKVASRIINVAFRKYKPEVISFNSNQVERYLGVKIPIKKIKAILTGLGFKVSSGSIMKVSVPWWRAGDIRRDYDLVEEVARIYGYHNLPAVLPATEIPVTIKDKRFFWQDNTKDFLAGLGFTEIMSYSLVSEKMIENVNFKVSNCLKLLNPLSNDLQYMRPTLFSGILQTVADNQNNFKEQKIFELSKIYLKKGDKLPEEDLKLAGAIFGGPVSEHSEAEFSKYLFYKAKGIVEFLLKKWGINNFIFRVTDSKNLSWEKGKAVNIFVQVMRKNTKTQIQVGVFGIFSKKIASKFGINSEIAIFNFEFEKICKLATTAKTYESLPKFPAIIRDLAMVVPEKLSWGKIENFVKKFDKLIRTVEYLNVYTRGLKDKKSLAFSLEFRSDERTLESKEIDGIVEKLVVALKKEFGAELRRVKI